MSKHYQLEEQNDRLWVKAHNQQQDIRELSFKVKAYEMLLSQDDIAAVAEELRIRRLLEAYPPTVYEARQALEALHTKEHEPTCRCTLEAQHQAALASV